MKRLLVIFLFAGALCVVNSASATEISKLMTQNGKTYLTVNNVPFPVLGAQIRLDALLNCDNKTMADVEAYFVKAKELGVNCVQIPISWKMIESQQDIFTFDKVDKILEYANKYGLKIELLWFSTNMIGDSFSYLVPSYLLYPADKRFVRNNEGSFWNYYGFQYTLIFDDEWILQRETDAVRKLMNHIGEWDRANNLRHPVISVQVHNEPDGFARWRYSQLNIRYRDSRPFSKEEAWTMTLRALDAVGKAAKDSEYKVVTRTNIVTYAGLKDFPEVAGANPEDVFNLEGIDFISYDPYVSSVDIIKNNTLEFNAIPGNYTLIAENKGTYENTASLILTAVALGSGYDIYDLATSKFFIDNTSPDFKDQIDHGVYTWDLKEKAHTPSVRSILKGLTAAFPEVAVCPAADFAPFNINGQQPELVCSQTINTTRVRYQFATTDGAMGFALTRDNYLLVYATDAARVQLSNGTFTDAVCGHYNEEGLFVREKDASLVDGQVLNAEKGVLYKINYTPTGALVSNTIDFTGTRVNDKVEYPLLNFEDEDETNDMISHLHTSDWQTNPAYVRNLFTINPDQSGINTTERCASFAGYNSGNEWWYGLDIVLRTPVQLTDNMKFVHAAIMTNNTSVDVNRGLILLNSGGAEMVQTWHPVSGEWADYVFPIPSGATNIGELRFMFNHKAGGQITYLDEVVINNDPNPRTILAGNDNVGEAKEFYVYAADRNIKIVSNTNSLPVKIYNLMGQQIFSGIMHEHETEVPVINPEIYLVKGHKTVQKVMVQ